MQNNCSGKADEDVICKKTVRAVNGGDNASPELVVFNSSM
jgi:hypothetical protein